MHVYILTNNHKTLYIGVTSDIACRLQAHSDAPYKSYTKRYNCDRLVYVESFDSPDNAIMREKQLKRWSRTKKVQLINNLNPSWDTIEVG